VKGISFLWRAALVMPLISVLAACTTNDAPQSSAAAPPTAAATSQQADTPSPPGTESAAALASGQMAHATAEIYPAQSGLLGSPKTGAAQSSISEQGDITLNFVNADVKNLVKAILGDYLKLNYEIGADVQGTVTIQTSQPLSRAKVLPVLDQTLRLNGMAIIRENNIYKIVTIADAGRQSGPVTAGGRRGLSGYGIEVAPIRYISAQEMQKLLEPLAPSQAIVHVDTARNVLIIEGTAEERETLLADIALFDADWLSGMSFALYTPNYMDADELTKELTQVLGGINGPAASIVHFVPIERLNAVLAISPQTRYLEQLRAWVNRLDKPGQGSDKRIYVYHVQHGRASDLARTLAQAMFGKRGNSPAAAHTVEAPQFPDQQPPAPAPGSPNALVAPASPSTAQAPSEPTQFSGSMATEGTGAAQPINVTADEANNALVIVASPQQYGSIQNALSQLDVAPLQVLLEAAIAEVTLTNNLSYGVQYYFQPNAQNQIVLSNSATTGAAISATYPGFSYIFAGNNIKVVLDALSTITKVQVLSSPQLMVLNNQTATLQVGDQVPILSQQAVGVTTSLGSVVNSILYQNTGVILQVTPRINRGGEVMMDISQEVSDVSSTTTSTIDSPTIEQRKITTTVAVQDGETVALGGLISKSKTETKSGIPFLQEIPVLGNAFRDTENNDTRTELVVLITPHVVDSVLKARSVTEELRRKLPTVEPFLEKSH
jgi:general secretion pathway protein D